MSSPPPGAVTPGAVALVPVIAGDDVGLLLIERDDPAGGVALPSVDLDACDATWQDALVRAVREQAGLSVAFDTHVATVSCPTGQVLIFGQAHPIGADRPAGARVRVIAAGQTDVPFAVEVHAAVIAQWFADHGAARTDRRRAVTGRRAVDAAALALTDLDRAVQAIGELVAQRRDFGEDPYAGTLLDHVLSALSADQRGRWGERASDLLLTFLWHPPRDQLPVQDMFDRAAQWARSEATGQPPACFDALGIGRARAWMDGVALAHGLGRVMAPFHVADPVGLIRAVLGFGRFGRLDALLRGETGDILAQLDEDQWELVYAELGARRPAALTPAGLDTDTLLGCFADVLAQQPQQQLRATA